MTIACRVQDARSVHATEYNFYTVGDAYGLWTYGGDLYTRCKHNAAAIHSQCAEVVLE